MVRYIPDCFWPLGEKEGIISHEAICVINTTERPLRVTINLYFTDRDMMKDFFVEVAPKRTAHIRMDQIENSRGERVPRNVPYAAEVLCDEEIPVQYSRLDNSGAARTLMTTML